MRSIPATVALERHRANLFHRWNAAPTSGDLSTIPENAAPRIHGDYAVIRPPVLERKWTAADPIFAMGSCFAREIEHYLARAKHNVVSIDKVALDRPEFMTPDGAKSGAPRTGFFHRFTPPTMLQELRQCFDEIPAWDPARSLLHRDGSKWVDLNYWSVPGLDASAEATATRRRIARELVRRIVRANVIVLTLGFVEAWFHEPSGLWVNHVDPKLLLRHATEFTFRLLELADVTACLEAIHDLVRRHHATGDFHLFVTVSPVPLSSTFTEADVVVANTESKSILRVAAGGFAAAHADVHYFPSYEIVLNSRHDLAWRPDRLHVHPEMVKRIVATFRSSYFAG